MNSESPEPLVVFDAVCVLCCGGLRWILRHDRRGHWRFLALQSRRGEEIARAAGIDPAEPSSFLVRYAGRWHTQSDACLVIARDIGGIWRALAALARMIPRPARDATYRLVARHRYRWFGKMSACYVPAAAERARFDSP